MKPLSILIPTWNNENFLNPCVYSIIRTGILESMADLIIINNGKQDIERHFAGIDGIKVLNPGKNLGWEGGLELGVKETNSPFVVFQNDDTHIPPISHRIYQRMLSFFQDDNIAAVGPTTTVAAGLHSIFNPSCPLTPSEVSFLIFFTVMVRRSHYDAVGGIDTQLPGGDDLDLSMRFRKAGYKIVVDPGSFIIHHGFKTGERVKGGPDTKGGWNSSEMQERTNNYLIKKHGFKDWWKTMGGLTYNEGQPSKDLEGDLVRSFISEKESVLELGCGATKTVPQAIGVDRIPKGQPIPHLHGALSVADIVADVGEEISVPRESFDVVISRHILEHVLREIKTLKEWGSFVKPGGKMIIAVPDERVTKSIPLNPEHLRAYSEESLRDVMEQLGWNTLETSSSQNGVSFVGVFEKPSFKERVN